MGAYNSEEEKRGLEQMDYALGELQSPSKDRVNVVGEKLTLAGLSLASSLG